MNKNINNTEIKRMLELIRDTVNEAYSDDDDEVGAIVHNACMYIAEELGIVL